MNNAQQKISRFIALVLILAGFSVSAQAYSKSIEADFTKYLEAIQNKDFDTSLDYLVEKVFDIVPRETMVEVMDRTFNAEGIEFYFGDFVIKEIGEPQVIDSTSYIILKYASDMSIKIESNESKKEVSEDEERMMRIMTSAALEQQFGKENVKYNDSTTFFDITALKEAVAVKINNKKQWKFLVVEKSNPFLLKAILPDPILEKVLTED
ncbi:hypothetical protein [Winogradskyella sp. PE311]|uniref:hypothetical protein n=1 Tax=Winogradskyella sp. PE311 TaxID=3366943 RepID=UPI003980EC7B